VQLTDYNSQAPEYSPEGNSIVCMVFDDQVTPKGWRNAIVPSAGGAPSQQFDRPNYTYQYARWTRDGRFLSYIGQPSTPSNIWLQAVAGGEPHKLTDFKTDMIFRHAWSRDGKTLMVVRGSRTTDVVLLKDAGNAPLQSRDRSDR
jgi:Tol biopolymer transport system component